MVIILPYLRINKAHNGWLSINGAEFKCSPYYYVFSQISFRALWSVSLKVA